MTLLNTKKDFKMYGKNLLRRPSTDTANYRNSNHHSPHRASSKNFDHIPLTDFILSFHD